MTIFKKMTNILNNIRRKKQQEEDRQMGGRERENFENRGNDYGARTTTEVQDSFRSASIFSSYNTMPSYYNIGWFAKKCLYKYYNLGAFHLNCTSNEFNNIDWLSMFSFGDVSQKLDKVTGGIGVREAFDIFELSQSWQTDAWVSTIGCIYDSAIGILSSLLKGAYLTSNDQWPLAEVDIGYELYPIKVLATIPIIRPDKMVEAYAVLMPHENFLFGLRGVFDAAAMEFNKHIASMGFRSFNTELSMKLKNFEDVRCSVFQRIGERCALALKYKLYGTDANKFSVGGQCFIYESLLFKARFCDDGDIGLIFKHYISDGVEAIFHLGGNTNSFTDGSYKLGVGWSLYC